MEVHWPGRWCRTACTSRSPGHWGSAHPIRSVQYPWTLFSLLTGRSHPTPSPESTRQTSRDCSWKMHSPSWLRDCLLDFVKKERKKKQDKSQRESILGVGVAYLQYTTPTVILESQRLLIERVQRFPGRHGFRFRYASFTVHHVELHVRSCEKANRVSNFLCLCAVGDVLYIYI